MNCKPGDLASIVGGLSNPSPNIGRVVEVIRLEVVDAVIGPVWNCKSSQPLQTVHGLKDDFHVRDAWLRPIGGVPIHDEVTEDLQEPA
ncbi:hypothetical protein ABH944_004837 [Caballeronia udeis]|uniref:Uncharacterized protein n=1 Tax=Caballeronia udeis TaxID=1232866 RepID=A0ABW8MMQ8_9BURK